jgi:hypothetical protein
MHFLDNQLVDVDGDRGSVETYGVAYHWKGEPAGTPHPGNLIVGVCYHDTMVRVGDRWLIAARTTDPVWGVGQPV